MQFIKLKYILILIVLTTAFGTRTEAQPVYQIQCPFNTSPNAGAELHILLHHTLSSLENKYVPTKIFRNNNFFAKSGNIIYTLLRLGSYDFYMAYIPVINQHEYFGHLARAKQLNAGFTRYEIYLFPPDGGRAFFGNHKYNLTNSEQILEYIGGVESNAIMAEQIRLNSILKGEMSFQDAMLYIGARTDFIGYILLEDNGSYDDVNNYLHILNKGAEREKIISKRNLILPAVLSFLLDPYTIHSIYSIIDDFVFHGRTLIVPLSSIIKKKTGILPFYSFEPAVNGLQHSLNGYILTGRHIFKTAVQWEALNHHNCYGLGMAMYGFSSFRKTVSFDVELRYWNDSDTFYHNQEGKIQTSNSNGVLLGCKIYLKTLRDIVPGKDLYITSGVSLKSPGFTKGYPLAGGVLFNVGIGYAG